MHLSKLEILLLTTKNEFYHYVKLKKGLKRIKNENGSVHLSLNPWSITTNKQKNCKAMSSKFRVKIISPQNYIYDQ